MRNLLISGSVFLIFCLNFLYFQGSIFAKNESADFQAVDNNEDISAQAKFPPDLNPVLVGIRKDIVVMGVFATVEEPQFSTVIASDCPITSIIAERYVFFTEELVFIGVALKNKTEESKTVEVKFAVDGPIKFDESIETTIPANSVCLPFTNLPIFIPEGFYNITCIVESGGRASMTIEFRDDLVIPTPLTSQTPTPELTPEPTQKPAATPIVTPTPEQTSEPTSTPITIPTPPIS